MQADSDPDSVRADVWLWAARFFKTRRLSREAIDAGKVELNGHACKPGKTVRAGDRLSISKAQERFLVEVRAVSERRGPASVAQTLYEEDAAGREARMHERSLRRMAGHPKPAGRPDKRARRALKQLKQS